MDISERPDCVLCKERKALMLANTDQGAKLVCHYCMQKIVEDTKMERMRRLIKDENSKVS